MRLLLIARARDEQAVTAVLACLPPGGAGVQLREPDLPAGELLQVARRLRAACRGRGAPLLINDRLDIALAAGADGVHLPARGVSPREARALFAQRAQGSSRASAKLEALVGVSCHAAAEVAQAARAGADYALFSPVWDVPGKGPAAGLEKLREAALGAELPLFALGGITAGNAAEAIAAGARGVACIRFVFEAHDPAAAATALWRAVA